MYNKQIEIRWSDLDPNYHLRHSVYYDWGAYCRMCVLVDFGCTTQLMQQFGIGPILLREECQFKREIHFGDKVIINLQVIKATHNYSRWSFKHEIVKNEDVLSAIVIVDGAWLDTSKRKLALPPAEFVEAFDKFPKAPEFEWIEKKHKPDTEK